MNYKTLFVRLDKIGDLICTLPADQILNDSVRRESMWAISTGMGFVVENAQPKRNFIEFGKKFNTAEFFRFLNFLKQHQFENIICFQSPWWITFASWLVGIPNRYGSQSQWHHFLFLNKGLRQKRSKAIQHEADYNLDLVKFSFGINVVQDRAPHLHFKTPLLKMSASNIENLDVAEVQILKSKPYIVVHPGMAGSALNWSQNRYIQLLVSFFADKKYEHIKIVITGTAGDRVWLNEISVYFKEHPRIVWLNEKLTATELLAVLNSAKLIFAPSTGVLHLAASLGKPCLGIYSSIPVQHPKRWAARGQNVEIITVAQQNYLTSLDDLDVPTVLHKMTTLLEQNTRNGHTE